MRLLSLKQDSLEPTVCGGMQRFVQEQKPKWFAKEKKSNYLKLFEKAFYGKQASAGKAVSWMEHEAKQRSVHIQHNMCGHGGERMVAEHPVDGFCLETNTVFQFHGCHWHGCPKCYPKQ